MRPGLTRRQREAVRCGGHSAGGRSPPRAANLTKKTWVDDRVVSVYVQDQIDVLPQLKLNVGWRFDDYTRHVDRMFVGEGPRFELQARDQTAHSYRAGVVYAPRPDQQVYFGSASSFTPVRVVPADGTPLDPSTARNYEVGHRWQGLNGRVDTNVAVYYTVRSNLHVRQSATTWVQVGEQTAKGLDVDVNTDLGGGAYLVANYGYTVPRFQDTSDVWRTSHRVPTHTANLWVRRDWRSGLNAAVGARHVGSQFLNLANTAEIDGYTLVSGAVGYRTPGWGGRSTRTTCSTGRTTSCPGTSPTWSSRASRSRSRAASV
jgi:iron complex outermembrane recepter protein